MRSKGLNFRRQHPMHDILMITFKRPEFTRMSLGRLLETCDDQMRVWVWHNGSDRETLDVVRSFRDHPRFQELHVSAENVKLREPTNWFWNTSKADYLSKVDDDCLMPQGWGAALRAAHQVEPRFGFVATWLFYPEDFLPDFANRKMRTFSTMQLMEHAFVQGSGYAMKRAVFEMLGPIKPKESFTTYCIRAAYNGWINGWLYPFIHQDHMDDARSPHYPFRNNEAFEQNLSLSKRNFGISSIQEAVQFSKALARRAQEEVIDPREHFGWRGFANKLRRRFES